MKHLDIKVYGKVQGVFYRVSSKKEAGKLGISGYAQNMSDGTVEIRVEGEDVKLEEFLKWCRKGPILAKVAKIEHKESDNLEEYSGFKIKF